MLDYWVDTGVTVFAITCMHAIHNYIPATHHISRIRSSAAVLYVQFLLHVMLRYFL